MDKTLSIVVPVYNSELYLRECLDSLLSAWRSGMDIILVDDGSTDKSGSICDEYAQNHKNIRVIHKENGGVTSARLLGVENSSSEYVTFVDNDDWIESDMYERMMDKAVLYQADVVICDMMREGKNERLLLPSLVEEGVYDRERLVKEIFPVMLFDFDISGPKIAPSLCNKVFRRTILEKVMKTVDKSVTFGEDALCTFPAVLDSQRVVVMRETFYHYRHYGESVSNLYDGKLLGKMLILSKEMKKQFVMRRFEDGGQTEGYVAKNSLFFIRKEFLENREVSVEKRIKTVRNYIDNPGIETAFEMLLSKSRDERLITKARLIRKKRVRSLFVSFVVKEKLMKLRGKNNEN